MKDKAVVISFLCILYAMFFINIFKPSAELSYSERRKLAQFPEIGADSVFSAKAMEGFDDYAVDQIAFREQFRTLKAVFDMNILRKTDNNGIFVIGDMVFKTEYPINEGSVKRLCSRINYVFEKYLGGMRVFYAMVPDKNYYIENPQNLILDYDELKAVARENIRDEITYIDLFGALSLDCYFKTDSHWKQEKIGVVVSALADGLGADVTFDIKHYSQQRFSPFYGVFYGQSALNIDPDELVYLVNGTTDSAVVTSIELPGELPVYDLSKLGGMDSYDMFMTGPAALVTAQNPGNDSGRGLIIFRDSYASSLAPLLLDGYSTITLVDLRYIHPDVVGDFVDFADQDVLFLYSSTLFNSSDSIK